jgi:hypothetical protein
LPNIQLFYFACTQQNSYKTHSKERAHYEIVGCPTTIVYNSLGTSPSYYQGELGLFNEVDGSRVKNVKWQLKYYDQNNNE